MLATNYQFSYQYLLLTLHTCRAEPLENSTTKKQIFLKKSNDQYSKWCQEHTGVV